MRAIILKLHLFGSLIAGLFLISLGVTGGIMAFEDDLDRLFNPTLFHVTPQGGLLPATAIQAALAKAYPGERFNGLGIPTKPDEPYRAGRKGMQIFVDGYTGSILGTRTMPTVLGQIHQLHTSLLLGKTGHWLTNGAAIILVLLAISGVYLWWPRKRFAVAWSAPAKMVLLDLHHAVGIVSALFLLVLALTGIVIGFSDTWIPWANGLAGTSPPKRDFPSTVVADAKPIGPDEAIRIAGTALPGATAFSFSGPANATGSYNVSLRFPEDLTPGGRSWVTVDQYSGAVLFVQSSRTPPAVTGAVTFNRAVHTGDVFGYATKTLMSLASFALVVQTITGLSWWWMKAKKAKASLAVDRPT